ERRASPFHSIRLRAAVGNQVAADFAARAFDAGVRLALGNPSLRHGFEPRSRRYGSFRQSVECLADDLQRFAELGHSHAVTGQAIARGLDWHAEVEIFVRRVRLAATDVVRDTGSAKQRTADSNLLGELARNHSDALRPDQEEGIFLEHPL